MNSYLLIFLGSGLGGVLRYFISTLVYSILNRQFLFGSQYLLSSQFPYGTLVVNTSGCLIMGYLYILSIEHFPIYASQIRALLLIGFLGGYTTFSSFSIETINLLESKGWGHALLNILLSVALCLFATYIGIIIGKKS